MANEVLETIRNRHSYRGEYAREKVPREHLRQIMEAGLAAPSGCNKQNTSLIAIDDSALLQTILSVMKPRICATAPALICVLTQRRAAYRDGNGIERCYATQDYAAAIENMLLAAFALGYASCWIEGYITDADRQGERMAEILGLPPKYELICVLPVGRPLSEPKVPPKRAFEQRAWFNRAYDFLTPIAGVSPENSPEALRFYRDFFPEHGGTVSRGVALFRDFEAGGERTETLSEYRKKICSLSNFLPLMRSFLPMMDALDFGFDCFLEKLLGTFDSVESRADFIRENCLDMFVDSDFEAKDLLSEKFEADKFGTWHRVENGRMRLAEGLSPARAIHNYVHNALWALSARAALLEENR